LIGELALASALAATVLVHSPWFDTKSGRQSMRAIWTALLLAACLLQAAAVESKARSLPAGAASRPGHIMDVACLAERRVGEGLGNGKGNDGVAQITNRRIR
jgi:hypothetical protein